MDMWPAWGLELHTSEGLIWDLMLCGHHIEILKSFIFEVWICVLLTYDSAKATITKHHRLDGLKNKILFS